MSERPDPETWKGIVWHAYAETCGPDDWDTSTRGERLQRPADAVFRDPTEVADWIEDMTRRHAARHKIHLLGGGGIGETGDEGHRQRDFGENLEVLYRGDSLYLDFHHGTDRRMHLWVEAVHNTDREVRHE